MYLFLIIEYSLIIHKLIGLVICVMFSVIFIIPLFFDLYNVVYIFKNDIADVKWEIGDYCNTEYDRLTNIIEIHNSYYYAPANVKLVKGDVNETLPIFLNENKHIIVSLLYLDFSTDITFPISSDEEIRIVTLSEYPDRQFTNRLSLPVKHLHKQSLISSLSLFLTSILISLGNLLISNSTDCNISSKVQFN